MKLKIETSLKSSIEIIIKRKQTNILTILHKNKRSEWRALLKNVSIQCIGKLRCYNKDISMHFLYGGSKTLLSKSRQTDRENLEPKMQIKQKVKMETVAGKALKIF